MPESGFNVYGLQVAMSEVVFQEPNPLRSA
jgi:hypothetical protein